MDRKSILSFLILMVLPYQGFSQHQELDYLRSLHSEEEVRHIIQVSYSNEFISPVSEELFDLNRSKTIGETFIDPNFGRKWTLIFDRSFNIMNSERNHWNADTSIFFLEAGNGIDYKTIALFNGKTLEYLRSVTITDLPSWNGENTRTALRWVPDEPALLFYIAGNTMFTFNINTNKREVFQVFESFSLTEYDISGGDGSDIAPNGDLLIGNKGNSCFVFNLKEKKIVRTEAGNRVYSSADQPFPVFHLEKIDYATTFNNYIFSLESGIQIRDLSGNKLQVLYRRTPHMDPTFFKKGEQLFCGVMVRYNDADAEYYNKLGLASMPGRAYFHGISPDDPHKMVRFEMDSWPSALPGSGGQISANRYNGSTGIVCGNGPMLYSLPWAARSGECYEQAYNFSQSTSVRRFAHHYIGYTTKYTSSEQPEGWLSPDGRFAVIKTKWGWYKVELNERMPLLLVEKYLNKSK